MSTVNQTLKTREKAYGGFVNVAKTSQSLQRTMRESKNWGNIADDQRESLQTIASKIGRLLNGDANYIDNWHDIAGYAILIEQRLVKEEQDNGE